MTADPWWFDCECPWWAKLRRAEDLIGEVAVLSSALNTSGVGWRIDREAADERSWTYRFHILRPIPADLAVLVGDAIHNLRSSLDQIAYHFAERRAGELSDKQERLTEFPIKGTVDDFERWLTEKKYGLRRQDLYGTDEVRALKCVQPFAFAEEAREHDVEDWGVSPEDELREDPANILNALWNVDKHRRLPRLNWVVPSMAWPHIEGVEPTSVPLYSTLTDGQVIMEDVGVCARPDRMPQFDVDLQIEDSPSWTDRSLTKVLEALLASVGGWMVPRMLHVADGNEAPFIVRRFDIPRPTPW